MAGAVLLLLTLALAGERPVEPKGGPKAVEIVAGKPLTVAWEGVALPLDRARWYAEMAVWADAEHDRRELDAAVHAAELQASKDREAWWQKQADEPPAPKLAPWAVFGIGAGTGALAVLVGALSVRAVTEAPLYE